MSKIFDALERAETDRTAARGDRPEAPRHPDEESPASRSGSTKWWKGLVVGMVVGALGAAFLRSYVVGSRPSSAPVVPVGLESPPQPAGTIPALVAAAQSAPESAMDAARDPVAAPTSVPESLPTTAKLAATEPLLPSLNATRVAALPSPSRSPTPSRTGAFRIQVGAFAARENAVRLATRLQRIHHPATVQRGRSPVAPWVVFVGAYPSRGAAEGALIELERAGLKGIVLSTRPAAPAARVKGERTRARSNG